MKIRTYQELSRLETFEERLEYLSLRGKVGADTFGFDRIFNQMFYKGSTEWKAIRDFVIARDNGCDLGVKGYEIHGERIIIHHLNPITLDDIKNASEFLLDPNYLITTIHSTHNIIHYGGEFRPRRVLVERTKNDTCPWRR